METKLLLIEDNQRIQLANRDMLTLLGYDVAIALNLAEARERLSENPPDAIVLDIMLPDGSGLDFLSEIRQGSAVPVLMLTALGTADDTVKGLSTGADDYLAKPYDYQVLAARIEALLRRAGRVPETLQKGDLTFNVLPGQAYLLGEDMLLTKREFSCLLLLAQNENIPLTPERIYEAVWQMPLAENTQALRTVIARLRSKLPGSGYAIIAQRKAGYIFRKEE